MVRELRTEALDISGLTETAIHELNIDTEGANIEPEMNRVKVKVVIERKT
jgi:hypothetical protein